jgi:hypothetical protein
MITPSEDDRTGDIGQGERSVSVPVNGAGETALGHARHELSVSVRRRRSRSSQRS